MSHLMKNWKTCLNNWSTGVARITFVGIYTYTIHFNITRSAKAYETITDSLKHVFSQDTYGSVAKRVSVCHTKIENPTASHSIDTVFSCKTWIRLTFIQIRTTQNSKTIARKSIITCAFVISNSVITIGIHATVMVFCQTFVRI